MHCFGARCLEGLLEDRTVPRLGSSRSSLGVEAGKSMWVFQCMSIDYDIAEKEEPDVHGCGGEERSHAHVDGGHAFIYASFAILCRLNVVDRLEFWTARPGCSVSCFV